MSLATDRNGVPLAVIVDGANRNDHKLLEATLCALALLRPPATKAGLCLDKGYDYAAPREQADRFGYELHLRRRGEDRPESTPGWRPRRWVVERTHSWLHRARRLLIRWEKRAANFTSLVHLGCALCAFSSQRLAG